MTYAICFDFAELDEPIFAGWLADGALGFAPTLKTAARFEREADARGNLEYAYGPEMSKWGAVVEVAA